MRQAGIGDEVFAATAAQRVAGLLQAGTATVSVAALGAQRLGGLSSAAVVEYRNPLFVGSGGWIPNAMGQLRSLTSVVKFETVEKDPGLPPGHLVPIPDTQPNTILLKDHDMTIKRAAKRGNQSRPVLPGEAMAIAPSAILRGADGFFLMFGAPVPATTWIDDVACVHVRGPLEHHDGDGGDSYESILARVTAAYDGGEDEEGNEQAPAQAVVLCIDSPGGVVSGLNETVSALQKLRKSKGRPLVAYVNELAASAAYALCCACDEIACPPSAILGSIGVISTICSMAERDEKDGLDVRLITSGERKADGHAHAPITDAAIEAETARVDKLAKAFFRIASDARGISVGKIKALQAGIFLGDDAEERGLADAVMTFDDAVLALSHSTGKKVAQAKGNETDRRADDLLDKRSESGSLRHNLAHPGTKGLKMALKVTAERKKLEAAIAVEKSPKKLAALQAQLEAYKKVEKHIEHTKSEEDDDPEDDEDKKHKGDDGDEEDDEEDDEESSAKKPSEKKAAKSSEEDDEEEASSKKSEEKAALSSYRQLASILGVKGNEVPGALKAALEKAAKYDDLAGDVAALKATQVKAAKNALIDEAVAQRRITRSQAKDLRTEKMSFIRGFLNMHKSALVNVDEEALLVPDGTPAADIPASMKRIVEQAVQMSGLDGEKAEKFREESYAEHRKALAQQGNAGVTH